MKRFIPCSLPILFCGSLAMAGQTVPIYFFEALAPRDTTSSEQFRKEYESAINLGIRLTEKELRSCGFQIKPVIQLYNASDSLQAHEYARQAENAGAWLVVGPRRSNHYLLIANGAPNVPSVSVMAAASELEALGSLHLSNYANNGQLALAAAKITQELSANKKAATYFTVLSEDCLFCKDFSLKFDEAASQARMVKVGQIGVIGETPNTDPVVEAVLKAKPSFVLVPNYSRVTTQIIAAVHQKLPPVVFIGGDGWGDGQFGFVDKNPAVGPANGVTVRGFPPVEKGLGTFPLGKQALKLSPELAKAGVEIPKSGPGMALLRILQGTKDLLCGSRPKSWEDFREAFRKKGARHFSAPWGVSAYRLENGRITYWKDIPLTPKERNPR